MLGRVLLVVDGSIPADEVALLASGLLPQPTAIVVLQVVPQLPLGWAWPALPDATDGLGRASEYVSQVARFLRALGRNPSTRVYCSPLGVAEMDREILHQAEMLCPELICLALEKGSVRAGIVREAAISVLVANPPLPGEAARGRRVESPEEKMPALTLRAILSNPAGALVFRQAGRL
jgi:hypothetical protein